MGQKRAALSSTDPGGNLAYATRLQPCTPRLPCEHLFFLFAAEYLIHDFCLPCRYFFCPDKIVRHPRDLNLALILSSEYGAREVQKAIIWTQVQKIRERFLDEQEGNVLQAPGGAFLTIDIILFLLTLTYKEVPAQLQVLADGGINLSWLDPPLGSAGDILREIVVCFPPPPAF